MLEVMARFAALRASVFRGGNSPDAWAGWLLERGYMPDETREAVNRLVDRTKGGQWLEIGDLTDEIKKLRLELVRGEAQDFRRRRDEDRRRRLAERVQALVADGWDEYQARVQAVGEIPDETARETDRRFGIADGRRVTTGSSLVPIGAVPMRLVGGGD